jgi:hypothetical protein
MSKNELAAPGATQQTKTNVCLVLRSNLGRPDFYRSFYRNHYTGRIKIRMQFRVEALALVGKIKPVGEFQTSNFDYLTTNGSDRREF